MTFERGKQTKHLKRTESFFISMAIGARVRTLNLTDSEGVIVFCPVMNPWPIVFHPHTHTHSPPTFGGHASHQGRTLAWLVLHLYSFDTIPFKDLETIHPVKTDGVPYTVFPHLMTFTVPFYS